MRVAPLDVATADDDLISFAEATRLGYGSYSTLARYRREGRLPTVLIRGRRKIRRSDLDVLAEPGVDRVDALIAHAQREAAAAPTLTETQRDELRRALVPLIGIA